MNFSLYPPPPESASPLKERVARLVADPRFDVTVLVLILLSIACLVLEMALHAVQPGETICFVVGQVITAFFAIELSMRAWVARRRDAFLRNYWLDLLSLLPLLHVFPALRVLRIFRVLRLLRLLRLFRAAGVLSHRYAAFAQFMRRGVAEYAIIGLALLLVLFLGTVGVLHFEEADPQSPIRTLEDAFWWTIYFMLTGQPQGSGGFPVTMEGRLFAVVVSLAALAVTATFTGVVSALMIERIRRRGEVEPMELEELRDHIVVCGWGRTSALLVEDLMGYPAEERRPVVVVTNLSADERDFGQPEMNEIFFIHGDFTRVDVLRKARIEVAAKAVLLPEKVAGLSDQDRDARTVLAALTIEKLNPKIYTCAALLSREAEEHLKLVGVEEVVVPDEAGAAMLATATIHRGLAAMIHELASPRRGNWVERRPIPPSWVGRPFHEQSAWVKRERNELLMGVQAASVEPGRGAILLNPPAERPGALGDSLICLVNPEIGTAKAAWPS